MFNSLSLFASISLGCSMGYGLGGSSRQIDAVLTEVKESVCDESRTFFFRDGERSIIITHISNENEDKTIIEVDKKKYIFKLASKNEQLIATCALFPGMSFIYSMCGEMRLLCRHISNNGRCFISVDSISHLHATTVKFESFGMELIEGHVNWRNTSSFMKKQLTMAFIIHGYDKVGDFSKLNNFSYEDLTVLTDYCNGLLLFNSENTEHVICVRGCLNHSVDVICNGGVRDRKRYNVILPDRHDRNAFSITKWEGPTERESFTVIIDDGYLTIHGDYRSYEYKYFIDKSRVVLSEQS